MDTLHHLSQTQSYVEGLSNLVEGTEGTLYNLTEIQFINLLRPIREGLERAVDSCIHDGKAAVAATGAGATMPT